MEGSLNRIAFVATLHCLTGCAIGEILGMVIGTALGWGDVATIALAILLAFCFGYSFTMFPLLRSGITLRRALGAAFAADSASISIMEIVDNAFIIIVPGSARRRARRRALLVEPGHWALPRLLGGLPGQPLDDRSRSRVRARARACTCARPRACRLVSRPGRPAGLVRLRVPGRRSAERPRCCGR